jgi:hypothetical protein
VLRKETERLCIVKPDDDEVACTSVNQRTVMGHSTLRVAVKNEVLTDLTERSCCRATGEKIIFQEL